MKRISVSFALLFEKTRISHWHINYRLHELYMDILQNQKIKLLFSAFLYIMLPVNENEKYCGDGGVL